MEADIGEPGAAHQRFDPPLRIEPLGIELIGDDAAFGMDHHLAADQTVAIPGETALAANEMILIDPLPGARLEMVAHPLAIHQVHDESAARGQGALDRFEHRKIVLGPIEIAERIAEHADTVKLAVAEAKAAGVAFVERHLKIALPGALPGKPDQIARPVEPGNVLKAAAREIERMAALAAAQIEDSVVAFDPGAADHQIDFLLRVPVVFDDVAVSFEVQRVEQRAPPFGGQMAFEVQYRPQGAQTGAQASARTAAVLALRTLGERADRARVDKFEPGGGVVGADLLPHLNSPEDIKKRGDALIAPATENSGTGQQQACRIAIFRRGKPDGRARCRLAD